MKKGEEWGEGGKRKRGVGKEKEEAKQFELYAAV